MALSLMFLFMIPQQPSIVVSSIAPFSLVIASADTNMTCVNLQASLWSCTCAEKLVLVDVNGDLLCSVCNITPTSTHVVAANAQRDAVIVKAHSERDAVIAKCNDVMARSKASIVKANNERDAAIAKCDFEVKAAKDQRDVHIGQRDAQVNLGKAVSSLDESVARLVV
jgi:hypothetical protein